MNVDVHPGLTGGCGVGGCTRVGGGPAPSEGEGVGGCPLVEVLGPLDDDSASGCLGGIWPPCKVDGGATGNCLPDDSPDPPMDEDGGFDPSGAICLHATGGA